MSYIKLKMPLRDGSLFSGSRGLGLRRWVTSGWVTCGSLFFAEQEQSKSRAAAEQEHSHVGEKIARGKRRHKWTSAEVFKAPRLSAKKGGSGEWVAVEGVLEKLHAEIH